VHAIAQIDNAVLSVDFSMLIFLVQIELQLVF
jgi:hypothetical protein